MVYTTCSNSDNGRCRGRTTKSNFTVRCDRPTCIWAPYCRWHSPLYIGDSRIRDDDGNLVGGDGVFVKGWYELANGYPAGRPGLAGALPLGIVVGDYTIGTDNITEEQLQARYPGDTRGEYILQLNNDEIYDGAGVRSVRQGKVVAAMVNDCLPGNNRPRRQCTINAHFDDDTGELITGRPNFSTPNSTRDNPILADPPPLVGIPIPIGSELYAQYGNTYWYGSVPGQADMPHDVYYRNFDKRYYPKTDDPGHPDHVDY